MTKRRRTDGVIGAFIYNIFNYEFGTLNTVLRSLGLAPVDVYGTPGIWKYILVFFNSWKWLGYSSVIYLATVMSIDNELYEAAYMDGTNIRQSTFRITVATSSRLRSTLPPFSPAG